MGNGFSDLVEVPTLLELLRWRAQHQPDQLAYTFLLDGETTTVDLTYGELDRQARTVGALLQRIGAAGERALLLYPPGLEYIAAFLGCLYARTVAVPAYPPNPARLERTLAGLRTLVSDARPLVALTTAAIQPMAAALAEQDPAFSSMHWLATDTMPADQAHAWCDPGVSSSALAFLQYTSGSTAAPKGVMLTHGNLLHNLALIHRCFAHTPESRGVIWLPPYHDMGLIGGILQPLYGGFPVTLMSPVAFLQRPLRWLEAISHYRATTSGGPNFAYDLCVRKTTPEQRAALDLSSWRVAFNGAEPINSDTLERFAVAFAPCGFRREAFYPCYGLAEATLLVSGGSATAAPVIRTFQGAAPGRNDTIIAERQDQAIGRRLVGCGQSPVGQQLAIVHPESLMRCLPGDVGEIWVSSPSVAQGYWGRPTETIQSFHASLADTGEGPFLRTGDLGFLQDGELFVTGRLKDLIIISGRNYYPQDIERTVEQSHPALRPGCGAAFSVDLDGRERLVVTQEVDRQYRDLDAGAAAEAIRLAVAAQHELQVYAIVLLAPGSIPKTSSGKIQRYACRAGFLAGRLEPIGSSILDTAASDQDDPQCTRDALLALAPEERPAQLVRYLRAEVARFLGVAPARLDPEQPVNTLGLDSLIALELQHAINARLEVALPMVRFLEGAGIAELANELLALVTAPPAGPALPAIPVQEVIADHPLSHGQRSLWFMHQLAPASAAYQIASAVRIWGTLDITALQAAAQTLVDRHPSLRTTFTAPNGEPLQRVHSHGEADFQAEDATTWSEALLHERLATQAQRPFDLARGPLLRIHLFRRPAQQHVLLLVVHHLVADLWSLAVLTHELDILYSAARSGRPGSLIPLTHHYPDYVRWQADLLAGSAGERLWRYWQQHLAGAAAVLELPADRPRPPIQTYRGAAYHFTLNPELTRQLKIVAQASGATLYMALLAVFHVLLYRYTGQEDILVGSPTAGRSRAEWAKMVGYFVNMLALRANLAGNPVFETFLAQIRQTVLGAFAHQEYPLGLIVERLRLERDPSRAPLFQVAFALQKVSALDLADIGAFALGDAGARMALGDLEFESLALEQRAAQFDLLLLQAEVQGGLAGSLQYNAELFDAATIGRMAEHFQALLQGIVADPRQHIANVAIMTEAERQQLLVTWNTTQAAYPHDRCIHELFAAQAARTPDAIAIVFEDECLTYAALNRRANQLAHYLRALGIGPEVLVGLCVERSPAMIVGLLGILKAGGAYVPLDPAYPPARLAFMLQDSRASVLITHQEIRDWRLEITGSEQSLISNLQSPTTIYLDTDWPTIAQEPASNPDSGVTPDNLAYVIYTSGSTGKPKGVLVAHRGLCNVVTAQIQTFAVRPDSRVLQFASLSFDASTFEILMALGVGATLCLGTRDSLLPGPPMVRLLRDQAITVLTLPPSALGVLPTESFPALRMVIVVGEACPADLVDRWAPGRQFFNAYGPTEAAIWTTVALCHAADRRPPIGRPIANTQVYVLDQNLQPVPVGVPGELYISVVGLARGYLNRPDLTAERFVPNPFERLEIRDWRLSESESSISNLQSLISMGTRLYKTGDLVRYRADGTLEFLGRIDQQVKLRGFRIEPGEIEAVLAQHPGVREAVVLVREDRPGDRRLVAYLTEEPRTKNQEPEDPTAGSQFSVLGSGEGSQFSVLGSGEGSQFSVLGSGSGELRAFLKQQLPDYMVPSVFVVLKELPHTPNGKLDRRVLPTPEELRPALETTYVAPQTEMERTIANIWQDVLGIEQVGIHDNFFELGGHSLLMVQVVSKLEQVLNRKVLVVELFEYPTVYSLAKHLRLEQPEQLAFGKIQEQARARKEAAKQQEQRRQKYRATERE